MIRSMEGLLLKIELVFQNMKQKKYIKLQSKRNDIIYEYGDLGDLLCK